MRTQVLPRLFTLLFLASCASAAPTPIDKLDASAKPVETPVVPSTYHGKPKLGTFGVDLAGMDSSTKPGADFNTYAGGKWIKSTPIPPDQGHWDAFESLAEQAAVHVRQIIHEQALKKAVKGSIDQKVGDYHETYLDVPNINKKGFAPAKPLLDAINAAKTTTDIAKLMGRPDLPCATPVIAAVQIDPKNPDRNVLMVLHSGLGLPSREHYLKKDKEFQDIRTKYETHIGKVLAMIGDAKATANAKAILAVETKLAEVHWPIEQRRDRDKTYNPRTIVELEKEAPKFPWKAYFEALGYGQVTSVIVRENTAMPKIADIFASTPIATWKAYLTYHFLHASADVLPSALDQEVFDFYDRTLDGETQQEERWKQAVETVNDVLGDAVGQLYVARHFDARAKEQVVQLVENIRRAYAARIERIDWMTADTKKVALEKLAAIRLKIGYPNKWKDYSSLDIVPGDAFGNARRVNAWQQADEVAKWSKPKDRDEWLMLPQTVDAGYDPTMNEIVFPAGILQPPFFDIEADAAVNYGGIGGTIGHELGHAFDDQGAKFDARGILRNWWTPTDVEAFKVRTSALADQYSAFEPLPGFKINGRQTLGENIGDLSGMSMAYDAYKLSLRGKPAEVIDGFTGDQRFFLGWAQVWRRAYREEDLRNKVLTDVHSPAMARVNGVVRNVDAWYSAFGVKEGDPLYVPPDKRVRIW